MCQLGCKGCKKDFKGFYMGFTRDLKLIRVYRYGFQGGVVSGLKNKDFTSVYPNVPNTVLYGCKHFSP